MTGAKMTLDRPQIILSALIILSIITIATVLIIFLSNKSCKFTDIEPLQNLYNLNLMNSNDNQTLVGFAGYLMLTKVGVERKFLPLNPKSIQVFGDSDRRSIVLATDCAEINIKIWKTISGVPNESARYNIVRLSMIFTYYDGQDIICSTKKLDLSYETNTHYSCRELNSHPCLARVSSTNPSEGDYIEVARLNLGLEVETDRDISDTKPGIFSKTTTHCPDGNWLSP